MDHRTILLIALATTLAITPAVIGQAEQDPGTGEAEATSGATWLSVTLRDLVVEATDASTLPVELQLSKDHQIVAEESRAFKLHNGTASLEGLTASVENPNGEFTQHQLEARILTSGDLALAIAGQPQENADGELEFRVSSITWPQTSPVRPAALSAGDRPLLTFARGWSSDQVTVAFAPKPGLDAGNATVHLRAWSGGEATAQSTVYQDTRPATQDTQGNLQAVFALDHLPPELSLEATLRVADTETASLWSHVNFPSGRSWSSGYDPGQPAAVEAGAEVHEVEDHSDQVTVPASLLRSVFPVTREDESGEGFSRVTGRSSHRLSGYLAEAGDPSPTSVPEEPGEAEGQELATPEASKPAAGSASEEPAGPGFAKKLVWIFGGVAAVLLFLVLALGRTGGGGRGWRS